MATAITIISPKAYQVFQRDGSDEADIVIEGTYTGSAPSAVEARWQGGTWTDISATIGGGTYDGALAAQTAGQGLLEVRDAGVPTTSAVVSYIGIGDVFIVCGQSNAAGELTNFQSYTHATLKAGKYDFSNSAWEELTDPTGANTARGSVWPLLATKFMADQSVPVAFVCCAVGGTSLYAAPAHWSSGGANFVDTVARVAASKINAAKGILWYQGENDAEAGVSAVNYRAALTAFQSDLVTAMGIGAIWVFAAMIGAVNGVADANLDAIRQGILYDWINNASTKPGPPAHDQLFADSTHWSTDAQAAILAGRWWRALKVAWYGGSENSRGAIFVSAARVNSLVTVTFTNVTGTLKNATALGWEYTIDGNPVAVIDAVVTASDTVVLTLGSNPAAGTELISYCVGNNGAGSQLRDMGALAELPPEPFNSQAVGSVTGSAAGGRGWYY